MLINIITPHLGKPIVHYLFLQLRLIKAKKQILQKTMNTLVLGPDFLIYEFYANVMNTVFVTLFYSSGMPLLILCATVSLFL